MKTEPRVSRDDILRALHEGPKRLGEIISFLKLPEQRPISGVEQRSWPSYGREISEEIQKMKLGGLLYLHQSRWKLSGTVRIQVDVPRDKLDDIAAVIQRLGGKVQVA